MYARNNNDGKISTMRALVEKAEMVRIHYIRVNLQHAIVAR